MTVGGGVLVDQWGSRRVWSSACVFWSTCMAATALAAVIGRISFAHRAGSGGRTSFSPRFRESWQIGCQHLSGRATAFGLVGVPLASAIGAPLLSKSGIQLRLEVHVCRVGSLGIAWALCWFYYIGIIRKTAGTCPIANSCISGDGRRVDREQTNMRCVRRLVDRHNQLAFYAAQSFIDGQQFCFLLGYLIFFALTWFPNYLEHNITSG